jgi:DNA replication protein DnaC
MSAATESQYQRLRGHLHYLRLQAAAEALPAELERATTEKAGPSAFLERLLGIEVEATERRRRESRLKFACLPAPWRLEDLDYEAQPALDRTLVEELATLRFVAEATNVLILGPPGPDSHCPPRFRIAQTVQPRRRKRRCEALCAAPA